MSLGPLYSVPPPRSLESRLGPQSGLLGQNLPNPAASVLFFFKPLRGIRQEIAAFAASALIAFTPTLPAAEEIPKRLSAVTQPSIETPAPSNLIQVPGALIEQGLANLLFQRSLVGTAQEVVHYPFSKLVIPPEAPPPVVDLLFFRPLVGLERPTPGLEPVSSLLGGRLPEPAALDILFQRSLTGRDQPQEVFPPGAIVRVPGGLIPPPVDVLFQRSLSGIVQEIPEYRASTSIIVPVPDPLPEFPDILFRHPLVGLERPSVDRSLVSIFVGERPLGAGKPVDVLFQRPLTGRDQLFELPRAGRIIRTTVPDPAPTALSLFLRPLKGLPIPPEERWEPVLLYGLEPTVATDVQVRRVLAGITQPIPVVPLSQIVRVQAADVPPAPVNVLFQHSLSGQAHPPLSTLASRIVRVQEADVPPTPIDILFQRPLGITQEEILYLPSKLIVVPPVPPVPLDTLFQRPLVALVQPGDEVGPSKFILIPVADALPASVDVLFQRPLGGVEQIVIIPAGSKIISVPVEVILLDTGCPVILND